MNKINCTVCGSDNLLRILEIDSIPTHCNLLLKTPEEAKSVTKGKFDLEFCKNCGHVFNSAFQPELMEYTQEYENSLHFSMRFQEYAENLVDYLISKYELKNKTVIDVGCGKGDFLKMITKSGGNKGIGFDPSYVPDESDKDLKDVEFVLDFYSDKYSKYAADLITCRHVLEHIQFPADFISNVRKSVENHFNSKIFFEVPNVLYTLKDLGIWDLIYEHCSYFSPNSLTHLFENNGFNILEIKDYYGGQFLGIETSPSEKSKGTNPFNLNVEEITQFAENFKNEYDSKVKFWKSTIDEYSNKNKKIIVWGGGSKGVTFLNILKTQEVIEYIVDINPRKQGMYASGSGQKFVGPEFLKEYKPDLVLIMNPLYENEIKQAVRDLGISPKFLLP